MATDPTAGSARLAPTLAALTLARLILNGARRFPYVILTPMAAALGVPRAWLETALALQWSTGILSPLAGPSVDRLGRKRMMLLGVGSLAFFAGLAALGRPWELVLFAIAAAGLSKMFYDPAMQAYIGDRTPYERRGMAIGVTELSWSAALFVFGPLAAYLIAQVSLGAIFAVLAACSLASLLLLVWTVPSDRPTGYRPGSSLSVRAMLRLLAGQRAALAMLAVAGLISIAVEIMNIEYEAWLRQAFQLDTQALGSLSWMISAAEVIGEFAVILVADRFGKRRLALLTLTGAGLAYCVLPLTGADVRLAMAALFALYLLFEISIVVLIPLATEVLPQARGTMMSANVAALAAGRAIGTLSGGILFRSAGYALNGSVALALNLVAVFLLWHFVRERGAGTLAALPADPPARK